VEQLVHNFGCVIALNGVSAKVQPLRLIQPCRR